MLRSNRDEATYTVVISKAANTGGTVKRRMSLDAIFIKSKILYCNMFCLRKLFYSFYKPKLNFSRIDREFLMLG